MCRAEDVQPATPAAPGAGAQETKVDSNIFKRTPVIDGNITDGEWDTFGSNESYVTYADWDSENLYFAAKSAKPIDIAIMVDGNNDGWYHGGDNYMFRVSPAASDSYSLTVSRYESEHANNPAVTPVAPAVAARVITKTNHTGDSYMLEMCIPADIISGLRVATDDKIGLQISDGQTTSASQPVMASTAECTLVDKKIVALKPLNLGFDLLSEKVARGEELVGKFHIKNTGNETVDVRDFVIAGEGLSGQYLSSQKVRLDGLAPGRHLSQEIRSVIPKDMPLGSWAVGAEVKSGDTRIGGALVSFEVVEPFEIALSVPNKPVKANAKDVTFAVTVRSNCRSSVRGTAKITLPSGWELWRGADSRSFVIPSSYAIASMTFKAKPPLGVLGSVPIKIDVDVNGTIKTAEGKFELVNP